MMDEKDMKFLETVQKVRYCLSHYYSGEKIVRKIASIIEESPVFEFSSARAAKFLDPRRPVFSVKYSREEAEKAHPPKAEISSKEEELEWVFSCVYEEIIRKFSDFIFNSSRKEEFFKDLFSDDEEDAKDIIKNLHVFSSIFAVRVDVENRIANIEYLK